MICIFQAASLAKLTISPVAFQHSQGCEKFESQNFKKIKFRHSYFIFVTYLPRKFDGRVYQRNLFFWIKIECIRESRSLSAGEHFRMKPAHYKLLNYY